ncbi:MAG TPA: maleylpyruvate isomerase N-terminal domain-containing protein, partial [Ilumatobacteraceae bacterium]
MERDPRAWVTALHTGHDRLARFVADAAPDDLTHPSMCAGWNVAQVLSHLGSGAEIGLATVLGASADNEAVWARWNARSPSDMASSYVAAEARVLDWYDALSDDELVARQVKLAFLPEPIPAVTGAGF